jgi:hypothetical protein
MFNEISIKVTLEPDDGTSRKIFTSLTEEDLGSYNALVDSPIKIHPSSVLSKSVSKIVRKSPH